MPRVSVDGPLARHRWLADALARPGGPRLSLVDLSPLAVAPTMLATIRHPHPEMPALAVGAASALTRAAAATKALVEACHTATYAAALRLGELSAAGAGVPAEGFDHNVWQYVDHRRAGRADFLDGGPVALDVDWSEPAPDDDAEAIVRRLARRWRAEGVETFAVDVTAPDVAELGLSVARVVSPQAVQLDVPGAGPYLGQPRLRTPDHDRLSPDLHPFP
jgi:ribosomal protein S12 methylthiotransferase accessory factor